MRWTDRFFMDSQAQPSFSHTFAASGATTPRSYPHARFARCPLLLHVENEAAEAIDHLDRRAYAVDAVPTTWLTPQPRPTRWVSF
jgi:hypothetical protein